MYFNFLIYNYFFNCIKLNTDQNKKPLTRNLKRVIKVHVSFKKRHQIHSH